MHAHTSARRWSAWLVPLGLLIVLGAGSLASCSGQKPLRVGFAAQLSGVQGELGVQERNGVQLAVEEVNAAGGIDGRPIDLIVKDDLGTAEGARTADRELLDAGVAAVIGHATSQATLAGLTVTDPARVVMLSPTATTPELSGRDDYFFRVVQAGIAPSQFAEHLGGRLGQKRVAVIYDTDNAGYSTGYLRAFLDKFRSLGGRMAAEASFSSRAQPDFMPLVARLRASDPDGLLVIASDIDTALIAQRTRLMGWQIPLSTTAWAQTETLINDGGKAVEGMQIEISSAASLSPKTPRYLTFLSRYRARFGQTPSFGAVAGYDSAQVLAAALRKTDGKAQDLPQALLGIKNFQGLNDVFSFDAHGDVDRPIHFGVIRDGTYVSVER
jgi:branched-chain amino acid transport system substrate-binding protein